MAKDNTAEHAFTSTLMDVLRKHFGDAAEEIFEASPLLGYLNLKTKSANKGSKARGAFANHYALYVVVEDYVKNGFFDASGKAYSAYAGARFSDLFQRQRELPFGAKLQNHALNSRLNEEFKKYYPTVNKPPIVRDVATQRYWVQEDLLLVTIRDKRGHDRTFNIAQAILAIIDSYVATKKAAFEEFLDTCRKIAELAHSETAQAAEFVRQQLQPNVDARVFEIVSYAVLKAKYGLEKIWIGPTKATVHEDVLTLYKTGRTNANDGGIDFVMRPLGRFFQVTETIDASKYFLDIDKVQRFPITFVVKSNRPASEISRDIRSQAVARYKVDAVVKTYMDAIEEIINVNDLIQAFDGVVRSGQLGVVMDEVVMQSRVEFNYNDVDQGEEPESID